MSKIDFNIPKGTKRIQIEFIGVSVKKEKWWIRVLNYFGIYRYGGLQIKLGDSGGIESSSYTTTQKSDHEQ